MDLWIRSQSKIGITKVDLLKITEKDEETFEIEGLVNQRGLSLGTYKTKERALEVLDEIDEFIDLFNRKGFGNVLSDDGVHAKHTIYHMPID